MVSRVYLLYFYLRRLILIENAIRPFVLGRKNWMFMGSSSGARAGATFYTLIETCKATGIEPYQYLCSMLHRIRECITEERWCVSRLPVLNFIGMTVDDRSIQQRFINDFGRDYCYPLLKTNDRNFEFIKDTERKEFLLTKTAPFDAAKPAKRMNYL
jgi:hypothetical protein